MRFFLLLLLLISSTAHAQQALDTTAPKDPGFEKLVKAYQSYDVGAFPALLAPLEKKYPANAYIRFFRAVYQDKGEGDVNTALRTYSECLKADPEFLDALMFRAALFADKGLYDKAIADATVALKVSPKSAQRYKDRADYNFRAGNYDNAAADFAEAFTLEPDNAGFYRGMYKALQKGGRSAMADAAFKEVLAGATAKKKGGIHAVYAEYLLTEKRFEESKAQWTKAFASADFKPEGHEYNTAAIAYLRSADRAGAEGLMDKALAADPQNIDYILNRADIAIEAEDWQQVYSLAQRALAINGNHPKANMMMAVGVKRTSRGDALASEYEAKAKKLAAEQGVE